MEEGIAAAKDHSPPSGSGSMEGVEEEEVLAVQHHPGGLNSFFKRLLGNNPLDAPLSGFGLNPPSHSADVSRLERFQSPVVASSSLSSDDNDPNDEDTMSMQCVNSDDPSLSSSSTSSGGAFMVDSNTGDVEEDMSEDSADISSQWHKSRFFCEEEAPWAIPLTLSPNEDCFTSSSSSWGNNRFIDPLRILANGAFFF